jgi:oligoendopeptidase F
MRLTRLATMTLVLIVGAGSLGARGTQGKEAGVPDANQDRSKVEAKYKWDLSVWFATPKAWEEARDALEARIPELAGFKGKAGGGEADLAALLGTYYDMKKSLDWLGNYAFTVYSVDRTNDESKARYDRVQLLDTRLNQTSAFIEPELLALPEETLEGYRGADALAVYRHYLDDLMRRKQHVLSTELEGQLALAGDLRSGPYSLLNALHQDIEFPKVKDEEGEEVQLAMTNFSRFRMSKDRAVREATVAAFFGTLKRYARSLAANLDMQIKSDIFEARARGYGSALEASLDENAVPVAVYDVLLDTTAEYLPKTLHRYVALRKKVMGVDAIHYYDLYNPLVPKASRDIGYEEGARLISEALAPLGEDYVSVMTKGMAPGSGWTDIQPNKGKRSGAYCTAAYGEHPFVFLNYMNQLDDVFTNAHEYGHALHFHLTSENQPYPTSDTPIFLAEIASTFNESMLLHKLLAEVTSKEERRALLNKRLENIRTTIFRQIMFAEFERDIHAEVEKGGALTGDRISAIYGALIRKYYGPDFIIGDDDPVEWAYVPHFFYNFYVYQYATGLMSAIALSQKVLRGDEGAAASFLDFLKAGGSDYPLNTLKKAGVDFATPQPMRETYELFIQTLEEFESLL